MHFYSICFVLFLYLLWWICSGEYCFMSVIIMIDQNELIILMIVACLMWIEVPTTDGKSVVVGLAGPQVHQLRRIHSRDQHRWCQPSSCFCQLIGQLWTALSRSFLSLYAPFSATTPFDPLVHGLGYFAVHHISRLFGWEALFHLISIIECFCA